MTVKLPRVAQYYKKQLHECRDRSDRKSRTIGRLQGEVYILKQELKGTKHWRRRYEKFGKGQRFKGRILKRKIRRHRR